MHRNTIVTALGRNKEVFNNMLSGLPEGEYMWKPKKDKWCLLEIICHLRDEERDDFRARVQHVLETPEKPLLPIDPVGWVKSRKYVEQDFQEAVNKFLLERNLSLDWLKSLKDPNWESTTKHPILGNMSAKLYLTNWLAHDYLHIRQINQVKYQYLQSVSPQELSYAGKWK